MAQTTLPRYQPSGFFRPTTLVLFVAAIGAGVLLAWLYQLLLRFIPFIYLNALLCAGFGFLLGAAGVWAVKAGHCRNRVIALVLALPLALAPLAASYVWEYRHVLAEVAEKNPGVSVDEIAQEVTFKKFLDLKEEAGWEVSSHGSGGSKMNGAVVLVVWAIEALIILCITVIMVHEAAVEPYCERCNRWGSEKKLLLHGVGREAADPLLAAGDLDGLIALAPPPEPDLSVALAMDAMICDGCKETGYLTVEEKRVVPKKKGKPEQKTTRLVKHAALRADQRARLLERLEPGAPPAASATG